MNREYQRDCGCTSRGNRQRDREALLWEIHKTDFLINDLQLYLDNHPNCEAALEDFNRLSDLSMELKEEFHHLYGPIINNGYQTSELPWQWTDDPWPWQRSFMSGQ